MEESSIPTNHFSNGVNGPSSNHSNNTNDGWIQLKEVRYNEKAQLGEGSYNTKVFRGRFDGQDVAVKRVFEDNSHLVVREKEILTKTRSDNVIQYIYTEIHKEYLYIVLELCVASLQDYVMKGKEIRDLLIISPFEILKQSTEGLAHLHSLKIVHRDLKPNNVLISRKEGMARVLISDFGISKKIQPGRTSLTLSSGVTGTDGWIAREAMVGDKLSYPMDIFCLGCIFYYVLTWGSHPFGDMHLIPVHPDSPSSNIYRGTYSLKELCERERNADNFLSSHIISLAISSIPSLRPSAKAVLAHPFFWEEAKQLEFLCDVGERLKKPSKDEEKPVEVSNVLKKLEEDALYVVTENWKEKLCETVQTVVDKKLDKQSIPHLLRQIRNWKHHLRQQPLDVRDRLGALPHGFHNYFTSRFPRLLITVYTAAEALHEDDSLGMYYPYEVRMLIKAHKKDEIPEESPDLKDEEKETIAKSFEELKIEEVITSNNNESQPMESPAQDSPLLMDNAPTDNNSTDKNEEVISPSASPRDDSVEQDRTDTYGQNSKNIRCMHFPNCKKENCIFRHPYHPCKNFPNPPCPGQICKFLHPLCKVDGSCIDNYCAFEHKKSLPSLLRLHYSNMREAAQGGELAMQQNGPERVAVLPFRQMNKDKRCHFFPLCTKEDDECTHAHPKEPCTALPNCTRGRDCPFLHGACKSDGQCMDQFCPFEHEKQTHPRNIPRNPVKKV